MELFASSKQLFHLNFLIFLFLLLLSRGKNSQITRCWEKEKQALLLFKEALKDEYGLLSSWQTDDDCCEWKGVGCSNRTRHVISLQLSSLNNYDEEGNRISLGGKFSPSLLELEYLTYLDLSFFNSSNSVIPEVIGSLKILKFLNLSQCAFVGEIPVQLWNLSNLLHLDLSGNNYLFAKSINGLSRLSSLRSLDLSGVNLSMASDWTQEINRLPFLEELNFSHCELPGMPLTKIGASVNFTTSLSILDLSSNNFRIELSRFYWLLNHSATLTRISIGMSQLFGVIPTDFGKMKSLEYLDFSSNGLEGELTNFIGNLSNLQFLDLSDNKFNGTIPPSLLKLPKLAILRMPENQFQGEIPEFLSSSSLIKLDLHSNKLEGELTNSIGNLSTLNFLDLCHNQLNGSIPQSLLKLPKLRILKMCENLFQGEIPELSSSSQLIELDLYFNKLTGSLPQSMGNLTELVVLDFSMNGFTGSVTEVHLHNLSKLKIFELSHNSLILELNIGWVPPFNLGDLGLGNCKIGPYFPSWLKNQSNLVGIELFRCGIDDVIPNWFGHNFPQLNYLNLSNNLIHGNIPEWSSDFSSLEIIDMSSNKIQSSVTPICNWSMGYLVYLDLSNNLFSGTVPNCLMKLTKLVYLNLGNNKLFGQLPNSIGNLTQIKSLHFRHNNLDGELPMSLQQCNLLRIIDFGQNKLKGEIPRWLGWNLQNLVILSLSSNQFEGTIPSTLCHLRKLQILDFSNNGIYGKLPRCLGNLTSMAKKGRLYIFVNFFTTSQGWHIGYREATSLIWKGVELEYNNNNLGLVKTIDLSRNQLIGEIPYEITNLEGLLALNISGNKLHGNIPQEIGRLQQLEFLDLSKNQLSGVIPLSLSQLHFIGFLNLSANNLSGRIPLSTQLQSFNASSYSGNPGLCGLPLSQLCPEEERNFTSTSNQNPQVEEEEEWFKSSSFYIATSIGFVVGLWGTLGSLLVNRSWRITYFRLVSNMQDSLYVSIVVKMAKLKRLLKN